MEVKKKPSPDRPIETTNAEHIGKVKELSEKDGPLTCEVIALECELNHGSVHIILKTELNMIGVADRWAPQALAAEQNQTRVDVAKQLYKRYENDGKLFVNRILAISKN